MLQIEELVEPQPRLEDEADKFRENILLVGETGEEEKAEEFCWYWDGPSQWTVQGQRLTFGRAAWTIYVDDIKPGHRISRSCKDPRCANPFHMVLVVYPTQKAMIDGR